jgi:hypothetical protein
VLVIFVKYLSLILAEKIIAGGANTAFYVGGR